MTSTNRQVYIKYARKNGLHSLKLVMENLSDDSLIAAKEAYNYVEGCYRNDRHKGKGRYSPFK